MKLVTISSSAFERMNIIQFEASEMGAKSAQAEMSSLIGHAQNDRATAKKVTHMAANSCRIRARSAPDPWQSQPISMERNW